MIYEYAIDPDFIADIVEDNFVAKSLLLSFKSGKQYILNTENCESLYQIRSELIEKIQNSKDKVKASLQKKEQKVSAFLSDLKKYSVKSKRYNYIPTLIQEHTRYPFAEILSSNITNAKDMSWLKALDCPLYTVEPGTRVKRIKSEYVICLGDLIKNSSEITFIDPYFSTSKAFEEIYTEFFTLIASTTNFRSDNNKRHIRIICNKNMTSKEHKIPLTRDEFEVSCTNTYLALLQNLRTISLEFYRIAAINSEQDIHDRFILTDIGGVTIGHGTSVNINSQKNSYTEISILSAKSLIQWEKAYTPGSQSFDWSEPVITL